MLNGENFPEVLLRIGESKKPSQSFRSKSQSWDVDMDEAQTGQSISQDETRNGVRSLLEGQRRIEERLEVFLQFIRSSSGHAPAGVQQQQSPTGSNSQPTSPLQSRYVQFSENDELEDPSANSSKTLKNRPSHHAGSVAVLAHSHSTIAVGGIGSGGSIGNSNSGSTSNLPPVPGGGDRMSGSLSHAPNQANSRRLLPSYSTAAISAKGSAGTVPADSAAWRLPADWPSYITRRDFLHESSQSVDELEALMASSDDDLWWENLNGMRKTESGDSMLKSEDRKRSQPSCLDAWTLDPHGRVRLVFDLISVLVLVWDLLSQPFILVWELPVSEGLMAIQIATTTFWTLDVFISFMTGYFQDGFLILSARRIARHYTRTWFIPDAVILFCTLLSLAASQTSEATGGDNADTVKFVRIAKFSRILRLAGVARLFRISEVASRVGERSFGSMLTPMLEVPGLVLFILFLNHLIGCCWFAIGRNAPSDTGMRWLDLTVGNDPVMDYEHADMMYQYFTCVHWSLTQMTPGSMQVNAVNTWERIFTVGCLVLGMLFFSSIVSTLSAKLVRWRMQRQEYSEKMSKLQDLLRRNGVSTSLAVAVQKQAVRRLQAHRATRYDDIRKIDFLPEKAQRQIHHEICRKNFAHPLFNWWDSMDPMGVETFCHSAISFKNPQQHDTVLRASTEAKYAYIVISGQLKYTQDRTTSRVIECSEEQLTAGTWICEVALWTHWTAVGTLDADEPSELYAISSEKVAEVVSQSMVCARVFQEYGAAFHARVLAAAPPDAAWPSDIHVPFCTFEEILPSLSLPVREVIGITALQHSRARPQERQQVKQQVHEGKCVVILSQSGEVQRIAVVSVLKLARPDCRFLVHLGTVNSHSGKVKASCELPGSKSREGETPINTIDRLLNGPLHAFANALVVEENECRSERSKAKKFGMTTLYVRTVHTAVLDPEKVRPLVASITMRTSSKATSDFPSRDNWDMFVMAQSEDKVAPDTGSESQDLLAGFKFRLCGWLTEEEFDMYRSDRGQKTLQIAIDDIRITPHTLRAAARSLPTSRHGSFETLRNARSAGSDVGDIGGDTLGAEPHSLDV